MPPFEAIATFAFIFLVFKITKMMIKSQPSINIMVMEWPLLGMVQALLFSATPIHDYFTHMLKLVSKHTFEVKVAPWLLNMSFIMTCDPQTIHYIFSSNSSNFNKGPAFADIFQDALGDGILRAESDPWKTQRKLIHTIFRHTNFLKLVETTSQQKVEMALFKILDHASDNGIQIDIQEVFHRFTVDVTGKFLLSLDLDSLSVDLPKVPFAKAMDDIEEALFYRHFQPKSLWKLQKWLQVGLEKKVTDASKIVDTFIYQQISRKQQQQQDYQTINDRDEVGNFDDLISKFMVDTEVADMCQSLGKPLETFLRDTVVSIATAGRDTTAAALTWFFWLVSSNPHVESKIREEIEVIFQIKAGDPWRYNYPDDAQKLNELIYLHAALCETLRLYPPVHFNHKAAIQPDNLPSGHRVTKDTKIIISLYAMARMEDIWGADCCEFKPERWIISDEEQQRRIRYMPSYKFNIFGAGPRTCIGKDLAFREMKTAAAATIWSYNIRMVKDHPVIPANSVILRMKHGLMVNVTKKVTS